MTVGGRLLERAPAARAAMGSVAAGAGLQLTVAVSGVISARLLGVEDRGRLALFWVVTLVVAQMVTLGLHSALSYTVAEGADPQAVCARLRTVIALQLLAAPVLVAAVLLVTVGHSASTLTAAAPMLAAAPTFVMLLYGIAIAQGRRRYRAVQLHRLLEPVLFTAILVSLAVAGEGDLTLISLAWSATVVIGGLFAWRHTLGAWFPRRRTNDPGAASVRELQRFGARSFFGSFGTTEHLMLDQLVVALLISPVGFGLYVAANAFSNLPRFIGQSVGYIAYPEVASATSQEKRKHALRRFVGLGAAFIAPVTLALLAGIGWLLPLLFGDAFSDAVPVARILLIAAFLQGVRRVLTEGSRGLGSGLPGTVGEVVFIVVLLAAVFPLASAHGEQGAALATAMASGAACVALVAVLFRLRSKPDREAAVGLADGPPIWQQPGV
ncbi:MAG: lipopolysaccharide biosynthesis protein [Thermoleophilaceae bacterium]